MRLGLCLIVLDLLTGFSSGQIGPFEGFGAGIDLRIDEEVVVSTQTEFTNVVRSHLMIRFPPGLVLDLTSNLMISNLTDVVIFGPATFNSFGLYVNHSHNIVAKNLRIMNSSNYGVLIYHSTNVIVDHCTIIDSGRTSIDKGKCIDLTEESKKVTISNNILAYSYPVEKLLKYKGSLVANFLEGPVENISIHHNLSTASSREILRYQAQGKCDFQLYCLGSRIRNGAIGNFIRNRYIGGKKTLSCSKCPKLLCFRKVTVGNATDIKIRGQYQVPKVNSTDIQSTVKKSGCQKRELWEMKISAQVLSHL